MKKLLFLIIPSQTNDELLLPPEEISIWNEVIPPYGVLSLVAYVKAFSSKEIDFEVLDLRIFSRKLLQKGYQQDEIGNALSERINQIAPDYIGLSALFSTCCDHIEWVVNSVMHSSRTEALVFIGGALATVGYEYLLNKFNRIDLCVIAEGEIPVHAIVEHENFEQLVCENPAIVSRASLENGIIPRPQLLENLDCIPSIDYDYLELQEYTNGTRQVEVLTSRGCPYKCVFCASHLMNGKKMRVYSLERVFFDLEKLIKKGFTQLRFFDDNFFFDSNRAKAILEKVIALKKGPLEISFPVGVMANRIDDDVTRLLKLAGTKSIPLAVESGSEYVLKQLMNKPVNKESVVRAVKALKHYDIETHIFLVVGLPGETDAHRFETIRFAKSLETDWASVNIAIPLKGSELHKICVEKGYLFGYSEYDFVPGRCFIKTPEQSPEYIEYIAYKMNLELNFLGNSNMACGKYEKALTYFQSIILKHPNHAFGHYCIAKCYEGMNMLNESAASMILFRQIISSDVFWRKYAEDFGILSFE